MKSYRITKYNPIYRKSDGRYMNDEWISIGDIGKMYNGVRLSQDDYLNVEDKYVCAVLHIAKSQNVERLKLVRLENNTETARPHLNGKLFSEELVKLRQEIRNRKSYDLKDTQGICRLVLREQMWCKLEAKDKMFVHFGYDYYMYVGCCEMDDELRKNIEETGIFVEEFDSPYL